MYTHTLIRSHVHTLAYIYHLTFLLKSRIFCHLLNTLSPEEEKGFYFANYFPPSCVDLRFAARSPSVFSQVWALCAAHESTWQHR